MGDVRDTTGSLTVVVFGATGMIGQGVLRECLRDPRVAEVVAVTRRPLGVVDPRLRSVVHADLFDLAPIADELTGVDATFDCVGVSAGGLREPEYRRLTYDLTTGIAGAVAAASPGSVFVYVSGAGTGGPAMWARVKAETEAAVAALPLDAWFFRPGVIQPLHGIRSRTPAYDRLYRVLGPLFPVLRAVPRLVTTTEAVGRAMLAVATSGSDRRVLGNSDINALAR